MHSIEPGVAGVHFRKAPRLRADPHYEVYTDCKPEPGHGGIRSGYSPGIGTPVAEAAGERASSSVQADLASDTAVEVKYAPEYR